MIMIQVARDLEVGCLPALGKGQIPARCLQNRYSMLFAITMRLEARILSSCASQPLPAAIRTARRTASGGWPGHVLLPYSRHSRRRAR